MIELGSEMTYNNETKGTIPNFYLFHKILTALEFTEVKCWAVFEEGYWEDSDSGQLVKSLSGADRGVWTQGVPLSACGGKLGNTTRGGGTFLCHGPDVKLGLHSGGDISGRNEWDLHRLITAWLETEPEILYSVLVTRNHSEAGKWGTRAHG